MNVDVKPLARRPFAWILAALVVVGAWLCVYAYQTRLKLERDARANAVRDVIYDNYKAIGDIETARDWQRLRPYLDDAYVMRWSTGEMRFWDELDGIKKATNRKKFRASYEMKEFELKDERTASVRALCGISYRGPGDRLFGGIAHRQDTWRLNGKWKLVSSEALEPLVIEPAP